MKRIIVEIHGKQLTYETDLKVRKGTKVVLPPTYWQDPREQYVGKVVSLNSDYVGDCRQILGLVKK